MSGEKVTHVSDAKKAKVKELSELMKKKTVMIISIKSLPSAQFQDIKKKLRSKAKIQVAKKSLIDFALDHSGIKELHNLVPYVEDSSAILFSDQDAFEIAGILADEKSPAKAKAGQIAPSDIEVKAGPTDLLPGPDISALSAVGLVPKVEGGKIAIMQDKILVKEGAEITENQASIMAKLDIIPFEVGVEPVAAYMDGKVYANIKIDKAGTLESLMEAYGRALPFAVEISYVNDQTLDFILSKAGVQENALALLIDETKVSESSSEEKKEEPKAEAAESGADKIDEAAEEVAQAEDNVIEEVKDVVEEGLEAAAEAVEEIVEGESHTEDKSKEDSSEKQ